MRWVFLALVLLVGCSGGGSGKPDSGKPSGGHAEDPPPVVATPELIDACAKHLELLHRARLGRELARDGMAALAGPVPSAKELDDSRAKINALGLTGKKEAFEDAASFARLAQPSLSRAGVTFTLGFTPEYEDDMGLARVRARRPGKWKKLWERAVDYELVVLDGFLVLDYPRYRERALEHKEPPREKPRHRTNLIVIDAEALEQDRKRAISEKRTGAAALEKLSGDELIAEIELREAAYLRFQDETKTVSSLDELATWTEILEGNPEIALSGGTVSAGDAGDEQRRAGAVQAIVLELIAADVKEERTEVMTLPGPERSKRLKELAPHYMRSLLGGH
jgi:hypothetical protein